MSIECGVGELKAWPGQARASNLPGVVPLAHIIGFGVLGVFVVLEKGMGRTQSNIGG